MNQTKRKMQQTHYSTVWRWAQRQMCAVKFDCASNYVFLLKEAPTNKLLYAKDIPLYKEEVKAYYKAIRDLPPLSSSEVEDFLIQESKVLLSRHFTNMLCLKEKRLTSFYFCCRNMKMNSMRKWP